MNHPEDIIHSAEKFAKQQLEFDPSGHDWWHIQRVRKLAVELAKAEHANIFVCELAALLHDVADEKLNVSKEAGLSKVLLWLTNHNVEHRITEEVMTIISTMSYNGGKNPPMETLEGKIVQDADRLDAIGAVGIARAFAYSGWKGLQIHHPGKSFENLDYRSNEKTAIYHFHEKLLRIKDLLNTDSAKKIAEQRHRFMESFLEQFHQEWEFNDYNL